MKCLYVHVHISHLYMFVVNFIFFLIISTVRQGQDLPACPLLGVFVTYIVTIFILY